MYVLSSLLFLAQEIYNTDATFKRKLALTEMEQLLILMVMFTRQVSFYH